MQSPPERRRPRVLTVDDNHLFSDVLSEALHEAGCEAVQAFDGSAALEAARKLHPDLITLDLDLPVLDGRAVLRELKRDARTAEIPVLVVTARPELLESGDYPATLEILCKPFEIGELVAIVQRVVESD